MSDLPTFSFGHGIGRALERSLMDVKVEEPGLREGEVPANYHPPPV